MPRGHLRTDVHAATRRTAAGVHGCRGFRLTHAAPRRRLVIPRGTVSLVIGSWPEPEPGGPMGDHGGAHVRATTSLATDLHTRARHFVRQEALHGIEITRAPAGSRTRSSMRP